LDLETNHAQPFSPDFYGPQCVSHWQHLDLFLLTHPHYLVGSIAIDNDSSIICIPPQLSAKHHDLDFTNLDFKPGLNPATAFGPSSSTQHTKPYVRTNLPRGISEKTPFLGLAISLSGSCVITHCCKAEDTSAENTNTKAVMDASNQLGKLFDGCIF
jgi:hypothetical protein